MANRVVMDANGLKVSKPGVNVLTAGENGLLFDTNTPMLQFVDSGVITGIGANASRTIDFSGLGFVPLIFAYSPTSSIQISYSSTSASITSNGNSTWTLIWAITNIPRG